MRGEAGSFAAVKRTLLAMALLLSSVFGVTGCGSDDVPPAESRIKNSTIDDDLYRDKDEDLLDFKDLIDVEERLFSEERLTRDPYKGAFENPNLPEFNDLIENEGSDLLDDDEIERLLKNVLIDEIDDDYGIDEIDDLDIFKDDYIIDDYDSDDDYDDEHEDDINYKDLILYDDSYIDDELYVDKLERFRKKINLNNNKTKFVED